MVPEKTPGSDPAVWIATVIMISNPFPRIPLLEAGNFGPVNASGSGLGGVYRSPVESVFPSALDAIGERQDQWGYAAGGAAAARRGQKCDCQSERCQIHDGRMKHAGFYHRLKRRSLVGVIALPWDKVWEPGNRADQWKGWLRGAGNFHRETSQVERPPHLSAIWNIKAMQGWQCNVM